MRLVKKFGIAILAILAGIVGGIALAALLTKLGEIKRLEANMIDHVVKLSNGIVLCFDENGEQMPEYQGRYEEVRDRILAAAPESAKFYRAVWMVSSGEIPREKW